MTRWRRLNPLQRPPRGRLAAVVDFWAGRTITVFDGDIAQDLYWEDDSLEDALLGQMGLGEFHSDDAEAECAPHIALARKGYGPFMYDLAAYYLVAEEPSCDGVYPSDDQSSAARRFWSRHPEGYIPPLSRTAFISKYGVDPDALRERGERILDRMPEEFEDELDSAVRQVWAQAYGRPTPRAPNLPSYLAAAGYKGPIERARRRNPRDLKGRDIPEKYLAGLSPRMRAQRIKELTRQRDRRGGGDRRYRELETDRIARKRGLVRQSAYSIVAERRGVEIQYDGAKPNFERTARKALRYYGARATKRNVAQVARLLEKAYDKGLKAWQTGGHRPGASQRNWGDARVNSLLVGGKTAWYPSADRKQARQFPLELQAAIIRELPEVLDALGAQGRDDDVEYLEKKYDAVKSRLPRG